MGTTRSLLPILQVILTAFLVRRHLQSHPERHRHCLHLHLLRLLFIQVVVKDHSHHHRLPHCYQMIILTDVRGKNIFLLEQDFLGESMMTLMTVMTALSMTTMTITFSDQKITQEKITLDENLQSVFPEADRVFEANADEARENLKYEEFSSQLEREEIPRELEFFTGDENENFRERLNKLGLNDRNREFVDYLMSEECRDALERDNISIHIDSGDIFINSQNTGESIYKFVLNQQDDKKRNFL